MKKRLVAVMLLVSMLFVLSACGKENKLTVEDNVIHLKIDEAYTIKVKQTNKQKIEWNSDDERIAIVSPEGTVTGVGDGITTIEIKTEDSTEYVGVIVKSDEGYFDNEGNYIPTFTQDSDIEKIVVGIKNGSKEDATVKVGETYQLKAYTTPSESSDTIVWKSDDSTIVRVDDEGKVQIINKGTTTVTAYAPNGVNGKMILRCK